jgi:NAD(P)-dependent dehydrogenase (short-subunit alcohol dehydrogenase family)
LDVNGPDQWKRFSPYGAYASSKLADILFIYGLARRLAGTLVTVNCVHPGVVATKLLSSRFPWIHGSSLIAGAATIIYLAMSTEVAGVSGMYFGGKKPRESSPETYDPA